MLVVKLVGINNVVVTVAGGDEDETRYKLDDVVKVVLIRKEKGNMLIGACAVEML